MNIQKAFPTTAIALTVALWAWSAPSSSPQETVNGVYPLATCPVSGQELGKMGPPVVKEYDGREVRFCCGGCLAKFEADQDTYMAKVDEAVVSQQSDDYPMEICPVTHAPLDTMNAKVDVVVDNRLIRLCCKGCMSKIDADPANYLGEVNEAVTEAQLNEYPLDRCIVSGEKLEKMGKPADVVVAGRLVRLCCGGCAPKVAADPSKYLKALDEAES